MTERGRVLVTNRSVRILEICVDRYGRLTPVEQAGRIYELLGVRLLYLLVAHLFGDLILPSSRELHAQPGAPHAGLNPDIVSAMSERTRYYEVSNLLISLSYLPLLLICGELKTPLAYYAGALLVLHGLVVPIERYKRALAGIYLEGMRGNTDLVPDTAAATIDVTPDKASASHTDSVGANSIGSNRSSYFAPRRFETDRFYRALGVEAVRNWVITFTRITAAGPEQRQKRPRSISGTSINNLAEFDAETRVSEVSHLIGVLLHAPFLVFFLVRRVPQGLVYILLLLCLDVSFVLLQRATRARLWRVLEKRRRASRQ